LKLGERETHTFCLDFDGFAIYAADLLKFTIQLFRHRSFICAVIDMQDV